MVSVLSPTASLVFNKRKTSELLNNANSNNPVIKVLYSLVAIFQYLKKEKKLPFSSVETGCFFSLIKNTSATLISPGIKASIKSVLYSPGYNNKKTRASAGPIVAPAVSRLLLKPNTLALVALVASAESIASFAATRTPLPSRSTVLTKKIQRGATKKPISGFEIAL